MHYRIRHLAVAGAMTMRGRLFLPCALAVLGFGVHPAKAVDFTGEVQIVTVPGKDKSVQRSLTELSAYLEYALTPAVSAFAVGYHDQEFRSATLGVARKFGNWQLGLGIGDAAFDGMSHRIFNPWAYFADDDYKAYLHYESYRNGSEQSHFKKAYVLKHFNGLSLGIHTEMDFGIGPRVEFGLLDGVRLWSVVPVSRRPDEGAMKGMIGVTAEF